MGSEQSLSDRPEPRLPPRHRTTLGVVSALLLGVSYSNGLQAVVPSDDERDAVVWAARWVTPHTHTHTQWVGEHVDDVRGCRFGSIRACRSGPTEG